MDKLSVIIPAAGCDEKLGCVSLIDIKGITLIEKQIEVIRESLPKAEIVVVLGYKSKEVRRLLPPGIKVVVNPLYEITNSSRSIRLGLKARKHKTALIIYGNILFNRKLLDNLTFDRPFVIVDKRGKIKEKEIGVSVIDGKAVIFDYEFDEKWCQIAFLDKDGCNLFDELTADINTRKWLGHEIFNKILDKREVAAISPKGMKLMEFSSKADLWKL